MKKIILLFSVIFSFGLACHAANPEVLDSSVYYGEARFSDSANQQINVIEPGDITCSYSVINSDEASESYSVICGLYADGVLTDVSSQTLELAPLEGKTFEFVKTVPAGEENAEIRAFLVRNLSIRTPLKSLAVLSDKSNDANVTAFDINGVEAKIDNASCLIEVTVEKGASMDGIEAGVTVADGASFAISGTSWDSGETVTVTSENGTVKTYAVKIAYEANKNSFDFESYEAGKTLIDADKTIWNMSDNEDDFSTLVAEEDGGNILVLYDNSLTVKTNGKTNNVLSCSVPFRATLKVRYDLPAGVSKRTADDDFSYSPFYVRNGGSNSMCGIQPVYTSNKFWFNYMENGSTSKKSDIEIIPGEWYSVEMYYYKTGDGKYCTDYTFTDSSGKVTKIPGISSPSAYDEATSFYFSTSDKRRCVISYDDLCIEEVKDGKVNYSNGFDDGETDGFTGAGISWSGVLESDALCVESTALFAAEANLTSEIGFKLSADGFSDLAKLFAIKSDEDGSFMYKDGKLCYSFAGTQSVIDSFEPEAGKAYDFKIICVSDEVYANSRIDLYVDGSLIANLPFGSDTGAISGIEFYSADDAVYIDDFYIAN